MKTIPIIGNDSSFLYRFLVSPRLRLARHATLIVALLVIASNLVLFTLKDATGALGNWIYLLIFNLFVLYGSLFYFNLLYLTPRYLLKQEYLTYILYLSGGLIVVFVLQATQEYIVSSVLHIPNIFTGYPKIAFVMDYLSSFPLTLLSIIGGSMTVLLRLWILENQRVMQLEKIRLQTEIEHLKEQVSPSMLFRVLHYSGEQALVNPGKASKMLMKLSQILRYQLYDCNREKVLLNTEIKFLTNYLELEQLVSGKFDFRLNASGDTGRTFIFPLLFIPFIQYAVKQTEAQKAQPASIEISLEAENDTVLFNCQVKRKGQGDEETREQGSLQHTTDIAQPLVSPSPCPLANYQELDKIRQRLDLQYGEQYQLELDRQSIRVELKGGGK